MKQKEIVVNHYVADVGKVIARSSGEALGKEVWTSEPAENFIEVDEPEEPKIEE
jgi:hypothetical protein